VDLYLYFAFFVRGLFRLWLPFVYRFSLRINYNGFFVTLWSLVASDLGSKIGIGIEFERERRRSER